MSFKFRKRIRIFPGFYLNLSKSGMSATIRMKGLNVNIGQKGTYLNTSLPGTGIYDRTKIGTKNNSNNQLDTPATPEEVIEIKSYQPELITSDGLFGLKESIINAQKVKAELRVESKKCLNHKILFLLLMSISYILIFGIFIKWFRNQYSIKSISYKEAYDIYINFKLDIQFNFDKTILANYLEFVNSFEQLLSIHSIWDITSAMSVDRVKERSAASKAITRTLVKFSKSSLDYINTQQDALKIQNANGGDLYIYPGFIVMEDVLRKEFALIDFRNIKITHHSQQFVETNVIPKDSKVIGHTWRYVNKSGSPDKRYKDNYQIPIALYYELTLETDKGLYESYQFSNHDFGNNFCNSFEKYILSLQQLKWDNDNTISEKKTTTKKIRNDD